jgi:hypothetical protein
MSGRSRGSGRSNPTAIPVASQGIVLPPYRLIDDEDNSLVDDEDNYIVYQI